MLPRTLLSLLLAGFAATSGAAPDLARGKALHDENCIKCHAGIVGGDGTAIYTRPDRRIDSLEGLRHQVNRCKDSLGLPWPADQIDDVVYYLNHNFYRFGDKP